MHVHLTGRTQYYRAKVMI